MGVTRGKTSHTNQEPQNEFNLIKIQPASGLRCWYSQRPRTSYGVIQIRLLSESGSFLSISFLFEMDNHRGCPFFICYYRKEGYSGIILILYH